ncbi:MAG: ATP-grasp domain-containing protein [Candidatus Bathyarchaeota archaeon]|nr:ATP-grasp domain-containing protein [Candidatus Bathyarchaeota archaeon]
MTKRILITGAGGPAGVNFTLSLKLAQEKMTLVGTEANEHYSTLAATDEVYVIPDAEAPNYVERINELVERENIEFVHPQPDIEVLAISENRERIQAKTFLPSKETVRICQDKLNSAEIWRRRGIPVARTLELNSKADVEKAFTELGTPLWIRARRGAGGKGSTPADNPETALSWINYWKSRHHNWGFIAQEHLQGRNIGFHSIWKEGELVTSMTRERLQYIYPNLAPSGVTGTPSVQRTIHDPRANKTGTEAVLAIDSSFTGIACVDLKENSDSIPYITEINPGRMFTTSFFFSYASKKLLNNYNANFPYLYVLLAYKEALPTMAKYNILPKDLYWIRHIDAPAKLLKDGKTIGTMYK